MWSGALESPDLRLSYSIISLAYHVTTILTSSLTLLKYITCSSRSHCLVRVIAKNSKGVKRTFCIVDLAGSERVSKSGVQGDRFTEAVAINQSLSKLGRVISGLSKRDSHIPFRECTLTMLLKPAFLAKSFTSVILHVYDNANHTGETVSTLQFGSRLISVKAKAGAVGSGGKFGWF